MRAPCPAAPALAAGAAMLHNAPMEQASSRAPEEIDRARLEEELARLRATVKDPAAGLFGPGSTFWEIGREACVFVGAGRAALLQLAHPWVAWAIQHHSSTREAPIARFQRTFFHVFRMIFSDLETVSRTARAVHSIHTRIRGSVEGAAGPWPAGAGYHANDTDAINWVHATLIDTVLLCFDRIVHPLATSERDAFVSESRRFVQLFGVPEHATFAGGAELQAYMDRMLDSDTLTVTPPAREITRFLFSPLVPGSGPLMRRYAELTAWLLPERLAHDFGLDRGGEAGRRRYEATLRRLRRVWTHLPARVRFLPPYIEAERRVAGRRGPDPVGDLLLRIWVGHGATR